MGDAFPGMTPPFFRVKLDPSAVQKSEPGGDCEDRNSYLKGLPSLGNYKLLFPGDFSHQRQIQVWTGTVDFFLLAHRSGKEKQGNENTIFFGRNIQNFCLQVIPALTDATYTVSVYTSLCSLQKLSGNLFKIKNPEVMPLEALCAYEFSRQSEILFCA